MLAWTCPGACPGLGQLPPPSITPIPSCVSASCVSLSPSPRARIESTTPPPSAKNCVSGLWWFLQDACKTAAELTELSHNGQKIMDRLAKCKTPLVAAINGPCMGGGLEVALAW